MFTIILILQTPPKSFVWPYWEEKYLIGSDIGTVKQSRATHGQISCAPAARLVVASTCHTSRGGDCGRPPPAALSSGNVSRPHKSAKKKTKKRRKILARTDDLETRVKVQNSFTNVTWFLTSRSPWKAFRFFHDVWIISPAEKRRKTFSVSH